MKIVLTGHRDIDAESLRKVLEKVLCKLCIRGFDTLMMGMAPGSDLLGAMCALNIGMKVEAVIPHFGHVYNHPVKKTYWWILSHEKTEVIWAHDGPYYKGSFFNRNKYMISSMEDDDIVLAIMSNDKSGTGHCVRQALKEGKTVYIFNPATNKWSSKNG